jgi:hypothetical protein
VTGATEADETSVRDLGGERLAVADREERVVLAVQHERRRDDVADDARAVGRLPGSRRSVRGSSRVSPGA